MRTGTVERVEEARAVLARLERIEALDLRDAGPDVVLAELRSLLREAEAWVRAENGRADPAGDALERCRQMLRDNGRTLLA
jgi:hypothetical protein